MRARPEEALSYFWRELKAFCETAGLKYPGDSAVRRRVNALRSSRDPGKRASFGSRFAVDQCALGAALAVGDDWRRAVVTLVIDRETKLICGVGVSAPNDGGLGIELALQDFVKRTSAFPPLRVADEIAEIEWVLPEGLEWISQSDVSEAKALRFHGTTRRRKRHGELIVRLIGDRLGPFELKRAATAESPTDKAEGEPTLSLDRALETVAAPVRRWNEATLSKLETVGDGKGIESITSDFMKQMAIPLDALERRRAFHRAAERFRQSAL